MASTKSPNNYVGGQQLNQHTEPLITNLPHAPNKSTPVNLGSSTQQRKLPKLNNKNDISNTNNGALQYQHQNNTTISTSNSCLYCHNGRINSTPTDGPPLYTPSSIRQATPTILQHTQTTQYHTPLHQLNNATGINSSYNNQPNNVVSLNPSIGRGTDGALDATSALPLQKVTACTTRNEITDRGIHNNSVSSTAVLPQKSALNRVSPGPTHAANLTSSFDFRPIGQDGINKSSCKRNQPTLDSDDMKAKAADVMTGLAESFKSVVVLRDFVDECNRILPEMVEYCKQLQQQQQHKRIRKKCPREEEEYVAESGDFTLDGEVDHHHHSISEENQHSLDEDNEELSTTQEESTLVDESTTLDLKSNADGRKEDIVDDMDDQSSELSTQSDENNNNQRRKSKRLAKAVHVKAKEEKRKLAAVVTIQRAYKQYHYTVKMDVGSDELLFTSPNVGVDEDNCSIDSNQGLTINQKKYDREHMVNDISTRNRLCEAVRGVDASSLQDASLIEMPSDEQAKIARISDVLSSISRKSISTKSGKADDLVHQLLKAYGLDDDSITKIRNRNPDGKCHELKTYIRSSPNANKAKLAGSVLSQHVSHQMSATLYKEFHSVGLNQSAPYIAMGHNRHHGETSRALALLIHDLIKRIVDAPSINLYVMVTEALRFDEQLEVIRQIINVFKALKVKDLVLDSMELDTVGFAAIGCKHRQKKREIGAVACHKHAGKSIISADKPTQLKIYKAAEPIQDAINAECTDNVTFSITAKAKGDGDSFVEKYRVAIGICNKEWQRLLKEVEAGNITVEQAIRQYLELPVLKTIPADEIAKLIDYGRTSRGTSKDPNYQLSLNVAIGQVLYDDDESVERMIIRDMHKNRDELGHEGLAALCMCIGTGHVDRSTATDPVRIGDNKCQIEMYEELCIQTDTLALFSRCHGKDIKAVAEMEVWRDREMTSVLDECKEEKEGMIGRELKDDRTRHDSFVMLKETRLSMQVPPEEEEKKVMMIKKLEEQIEQIEKLEKQISSVQLTEAFASIDTAFRQNEAKFARIIEAEEEEERQAKEEKRAKEEKQKQVNHSFGPIDRSVVEDIIRAHEKEQAELKENSSNEGRWTKEEHEAFLSGLQLYGKKWKEVAAHVKTRTVLQTRSHAQKYFAKTQK